MYTQYTNKYAAARVLLTEEGGVTTGAMIDESQQTMLVRISSITMPQLSTAALVTTKIIEELCKVEQPITSWASPEYFSIGPQGRMAPKDSRANITLAVKPEYVQGIIEKSIKHKWLDHAAAISGNAPGT